MFDRECAPDRRSLARRGLDIKRAVEQGCALAHPEHPKPVGPCRGVKAGSIVPDAHLDRARSFYYLDDAARGAAVLDNAADIIWAIASTRTYRALVHERRWTTEQYERWLSDLLAGALLAERTTEPG